MAKHKKDKNEESSEINWKEVAQQLAEQNRDLVKQVRYANYLTIGQFMEEYTGALREYMEAQYRHGPTDLCHPEDLAASAATFSDAWWSISQHADYNARGTAIGKP